MTNDSGKTAVAKGAWFSALAQAWQPGADGAVDIAQVAEQIAVNVGVAAPVARGWLQACEALTAYADSPQEFDQDAIDEEQAGQEAARRATLPVLAARLQARVDAHDARMAGAVKCTICLRNCQSRGLRSRSWQSTLGVIELRRRWSWCETDRCGVAEAQRWLRLPQNHSEF